MQVVTCLQIASSSELMYATTKNVLPVLLTLAVSPGPWLWKL